MEPQGQTIDRLGPADLAMLWTEDAGWRQDIGAIAVLDGGALFDDAGGFRLESVREHIGGRLGWVPRFSQVLHRPRFGLGSPIWVDAGDVDLRHHVGMRPLPAPGNNQQLLELCESLRRAPFDLDRPLWEMWLLPGVDEGRHVGLFIKLHHALADGLAGMAALSAFVDTDPAAVTNPAPPQPTRPMPSSRALFLDNLRSRGRRLGALIAALRRPLPALRGAVCQLRALYQVFGQGRAPRSSLNRPIGPGRRLATIPGSLDVYRDIAHAHAAKVNDVLLAAIGGGVADLLSARGESSHLALRAMVPVSDGDPVRDGTLGIRPGRC